MTNCSNLFTSYFPCYGNKNVCIVDGTLSSIAGKGFIPISKNLTLNSILHVPNLSCNLFLVNKFTKDSYRVAKFSSHCCEFQDLDLGRTIGSAREIMGCTTLRMKISQKGKLKWQISLHLKKLCYDILDQGIPTPLICNVCFQSC